MAQKSNDKKGSGEIPSKAAYLAAFCGPVVILLCILALSGAYPFGTECFLRTDLYHQYAPFFSEFREKLQNGGSLLYTWDVGLGVNFTALYAYYLASPLNWFVVFCPEHFVIEFITVLVVLKLGLCGVSMTWYLRSRYQTTTFGTALFGIFYALSGYLCAYYWDIMWLDCVILFPLIVRGTEKLCEEKKMLLYAASLGLCILSNYYISIMVCMFLVLWFAACSVLYPPHSAGDFFARCCRFVFASLLAGGFAAVVLLPEVAALTHTASYEMSFPKSVTQYFTVLDMAARHLVGVTTEQELDHWPNIYCGAAMIPLFVIYLRSPRIRLREKAVYGTLLLFFFMSFSLNVLNYIWHGFHYPNSLPARQSFIYIFLMLCVCFRAFRLLPRIRKKQLGGAFLISLVFVFLCQRFVTAKHFKWWVYYLSLIFIAAYMLLVWLYRTRRLRKVSALYLALAVVLIEAAVNTSITSITTTSRASYTKDNDDVRSLVSELFPAEEFFRIEKGNRKTKNDGAWLHFPSVSLFSSMANADCTAFFKALGCEASTNAYSITGSTPLVDMLFSVRYSLYQSPQEESLQRELVESRDTAVLYRNKLSLPIGFMMPEAMSERWVQDLDNPALVQDALCDMLKTAAVLQPNGELPSENGADLAVTISQDGEYYAYVTNSGIKKVTVSTPEGDKSFDDVDRGFLLELGHLREGDMVSMHAETKDREMQAQIYRFDYDALTEVYEKLSRQPFVLSVWADDRLSGTVTVNTASLTDPDADSLRGGTRTAAMFLSIPYDEGWQVTVDGQKAETVKVFDTFLGLELTDGTHEIELMFMPRGLVPGAWISAGCLIMLLLLAVWEYSSDRRARLLSAEEEEEEDEAEPEDTADEDLGEGGSGEEHIRRNDRERTDSLEGFDGGQPARTLESASEAPASTDDFDALLEKLGKPGGRGV